MTKANAARTLGIAGVVAAAAAFAACGDASVSGSLGAYGAPIPIPPGSTPSSPDAGEADATRSVSDAGITYVPGPDGSLVVVDSGAPPMTGTAKSLFEAMLPSLTTQCGGCHVTGAGGAAPWMGPPDPYTSAKAYPGIVISEPEQSILVTKGRHEGPVLPDALQTQVLAWLAAEATTLPTMTLPTTAPITIAVGANSIDLSKAVPALAGATLTFMATQSGTIMQLSNVQIVPSATMGVHVKYPIFVTMAASGSQTEDTSFSNSDQTFAAGTAGTLQPGYLLLTNWAAGDQLLVQFTTLETATVQDAGTTGGCKSVATFTTNAVPAIQQNTCLNCHNTGGSGNASLDLSGLAANPVNDTAACAQALNRINTATPAQSDIILAPTGGVAAHPFKNASATFSQMMQLWIVNEK